MLRAFRAPGMERTLAGSRKHMCFSQEDEQLRKLVAIYGPQKWSVVAEKVRGRSGKSCRLR